MANMSKPTSDISVEDGKITISLNAGFMKKHDVLPSQTCLADPGHDVRKVNW